MHERNYKYLFVYIMARTIDAERDKRGTMCRS